MPSQFRRSISGEQDALAAIELPLGKGPQSVYPYFAEPENPILQYWRILRKRQGVVLATLDSLFALSVIATLNTTPLYQATSKVAIFPENPNVLGFKDRENSPIDYDYDAALETQVAILRSDALAIKVIEAMHLDRDPRFTHANQVSPSTDAAIQVSRMGPDPAKTAGLLGTFSGGLSVQLVRNSRIIQVSYTHPDPRLATEIAN